jgi:hypothetical protein
MCVTVCVGFSRSLRSQPSEPHLTFYLVNTKHFTDDEVNDEVYTVWTYSFFPLAVASTVLLALKPSVRVLYAVFLAGTVGRWATTAP